MDEISTTCNFCKSLLSQKPIIHILNKEHEGYFCYSCAKAIITPFEERLKIEKQVNDKINLKAQAITEQRMREWHNKKNEFSNNILHDRLVFFVLPITVLTFILQDEKVSYAIWAFIISSIYFCLFLEIDETEFIDKNPEPDTSHLFQQKAEFEKINHYSIQYEYHDNQKKYRRAILIRDNYTCQWCLEKYHADYLEVHHIISRSQNGNNHPANLVTLCIDCHKKEEWYGHHHKYKNTRSKKQTSKYNYKA